MEENSDQEMTSPPPKLQKIETPGSSKDKKTDHTPTTILLKVEVPNTSVNWIEGLCFLNDKGVYEPVKANSMELPSKEKNTILNTVKEAIKKELNWGSNPDETDESLDSSPGFLQLMESWASRAKGIKVRKGKQGAEDKENAATPILIMHQEINTKGEIGEVKICVKWQDGQLVYVKKKEGVDFNWTNSATKCSKCWDPTATPKLCYNHSPYNIRLIMDEKNTNEKVVAVVSKKTKFSTNDQLKKYLTSNIREIGTLVKYIKSRNDANSPPEFVLYPNHFFSGKKVMRSTIMTSVSLLVMFHNSVCEESDRILMKNARVNFKSAHLPTILAILQNNAMSFTPKSQQDESMISLLPDSFRKNLPHTYEYNFEGAIYDGLVTAIKQRAERGSKAHSTSTTSKLKDLDKKHIQYIYQYPLPDKDVLKRVGDGREVKNVEEMSEEELAAFKIMESNAQRKETLQHVTTLLCKILELSSNDFPITMLAGWYFHYDDAFDLDTFKILFQMKCQQDVDVTIVALQMDEAGKPIFNLNFDPIPETEEIDDDEDTDDN